MTSDVLTISRYWHTPTIRTQITKDGIALTIAWEDFLKALSAEMGATVTLSSDGTFTKLRTCATAVCERIKEESIKVV